MPGVDAARMAVSRAVKRLSADFAERRQPAGRLDIPQGGRVRPAQQRR
jgi:hypothetical protein